MNPINPIYDPGTPRLLAEAISVSRICGLLEATFVMIPPRETVSQGCGNKAVKRQPVIGKWDITDTDRNGLEAHFSFHIILGDTPEIIGLDVGRYATQKNILNKPFLCIKYPKYDEPEIFGTSILLESSATERIHVNTIRSVDKYIASMVPHKLQNVSKRQPICMAKQIHRVLQGPAPLHRLTTIKKIYAFRRKYSHLN